MPSAPPPKNGSSTLPRLWKIATNAAMALSWLRVVVALSTAAMMMMQGATHNLEDACRADVVPAVKLALAVSFLELANALLGVTRSKPAQVLLFATVRLGVELWVAPRLASCAAWPHLLTVACWGAGDTIRFLCFLVDNWNADPQQQPAVVARAVRYTVGPVIFPVGASGEMIMVIYAALRQEGYGKPGMLVAASLWPLGFYPLFTQLLRQRRKFFAKTDAKNKAKSK